MTSSRSLRERWASGDTTLGGWCSIPDSLVAEAVSRAGYDYVCVDTQHGAVDYQAAVGMLQGIDLGGAAPVARVPWNEPGIIGKMLDAAAMSIIVPMVNTPDQARASVAAGRYAPDGHRSFGPTVIGLRHGRSYFEQANDATVVIPMIETVEAVANIDDIVAVPGVEAIYVGPADLAVSMGHSPMTAMDEPDYVEALAKVVTACQNAGVVPGIHGHKDVAARRMEEGFRMIPVFNDFVVLRGDAAAHLKEARAGGPGSGGDGKIY
jgi:4-hydroxy-2-oxoheptanedioate aldolase